MIKLKTLSLLLIAFFQLQCSSAQKTSSKTQEGHYLVDKQIDWQSTDGNYYVSIEAGENLVFELSNIGSGDPRNDTQIKASIVFSVDRASKSIQIDSFEDEAAFMVRQCRCIDAGYNKITEGSITGTLDNKGVWQINVDVKAIGNDSQNVYPFQYSGKVSRQ